MIRQGMEMQSLQSIVFPAVLLFRAARHVIVRVSLASQPYALQVSFSIRALKITGSTLPSRSPQHSGNPTSGTPGPGIDWCFILSRPLILVFLLLSFFVALQLCVKLS